ncbi:MAG: hypothetical protein GY715_05175 [Planctomycetes bacterium]|nr:hypothetical protein [Planctomycetota bacterium]
MRHAMTMMLTSALGLMLLGAPAQGQDTTTTDDAMLRGPKIEQKARGDRPRHGRRHARGEARGQRLFEKLNATDEQKTAIRQLREQMRSEMRKVHGEKRPGREANTGGRKGRGENARGKGLGENAGRKGRGARRSGRGPQLTEEQRAQMKTIRDAFHRDVRMLLDADQQVAFDEMTAQREKAGRRGGRRGARRGGERDGMGDGMGRGRRGGRRGGAHRERMLERFDANGDGTLDEAEREAAHQERQRRRGDREPTI